MRFFDVRVFEDKQKIKETSVYTLGMAKMNFAINDKLIKRLCGDIAFKKGLQYVKGQKVSITQNNADPSIVSANVKGGSNFLVTIQTDGKDLEANCSCPPLGSVKFYCQHVAAVLIYLRDMQVTRTQNNSEHELTNQMLALFQKKTLSTASGAHFEKREILPVEFVCETVYQAEEGYTFLISMIIGEYPILNIQMFLDKVRRHKIFHDFTGFAYDPIRHCFSKESDAIIQRLINLIHSHKKNTEIKESVENRVLIPPSDWEKLFPLLLAYPAVKFIHDGIAYNGLKLSDESIPVLYEMEEEDEATGDNILSIKGLHEVTVFKSYNYAFAHGKLYNLSTDDCNRLADLKEMLTLSGKHHLLVPPEHLEHFLEVVTPGLMKIGHVRIDKAIAQKLVKTPLKAKLFLDRVKNRLLAGLEFHYGNLVVNPLENNEEAYRHNPTLKREGDQEQLILKMMDDSSFTRTESGFYLHDEEAEYHFLYHVLPQLQQMVEVYATSAVKLRIHKNSRPPRIKVSFAERTDWLSFRFDLKGISESEIGEVLLALEEKRKYYKLANGSLLSLESKEFQNIHQFIQELELSVEDILDQEIKIPLIQGIGMVNKLDEGNIVTEGESFSELRKNLVSPKNLEFALPENFKSILRDYQKVGFQWLKLLSRYHLGGILADDMGLGKTIQSIAFIESVLEEIRKSKEPVLIVTPSSLTYNWLSEIEKFSPNLDVCLIDGHKDKRQSLIQTIPNRDVVIISYPSLRADYKLFKPFTFHTVFFDEAQAFKNPTTLTAKAVKRLKARNRFALTGTPIENSLEELWSIFHVIFPQLLPDPQSFGELTRQSIAKRVQPFILRRMKKDVLTELPVKAETILSSELTEDQKKLYAAYLVELKQDTLKHIKKGEFQKNRIKILAGLTRLRQLCCHPSLFVEGYMGESAKFNQLMELVEESKKSGRRMLIFSQFTTMLDIIGRYLGYHGIPFFYLDGQTPPADRVNLCDRFNEGEGDLFLISLKAGGTGLNLTGADTVILYDLWWNPAVEQQAADRAYRMGQTKPVEVIKLVARGTIEEKMNELQERKKELIAEVIDIEANVSSAITEKDILDILSIQTD